MNKIRLGQFGTTGILLVWLLLWFGGHGVGIGWTLALAIGATAWSLPAIFALYGARGMLLPLLILISGVWLLLHDLASFASPYN